MKSYGFLSRITPATLTMLTCQGPCTKLLCNQLIEKKTYIATIKFGYTSDTYDSTGNIQKYNEQNMSNQNIDLTAIEYILKLKYTGKIKQIPPIYSAIKINGHRAYDLARLNKQFEMKERDAYIHYIDIMK
jgi:tRNA pseudouridine55 synthase